MKRPQDLTSRKFLHNTATEILNKKEITISTKETRVKEQSNEKFGNSDKKITYIHNVAILVTQHNFFHLLNHTTDFSYFTFHMNLLLLQIPSPLLLICFLVQNLSIIFRMQKKLVTKLKLQRQYKMCFNVK